MANFLVELKRRHVYRVAAAYAVVAWVLLQLVNNIAPALRIPDWGISLVLVLLCVGFPIALIFAWTVELKAAAVSADENAIARVSNVRHDTAQHPLGFAGDRGTSRTQIDALSIAVLPFANMSGDASQEFFSDGMTEEITA
jgi:hypothetical protein